ncbi:DUF2182 domain-containing protein [Agromyces sp. MMS24-K17]|uniref:copper chaperone n=1 Tax=Agromyces sp. MMS24-K17 TaxID=3372850 RepID=UPI0037541B2D
MTGIAAAPARTASAPRGGAHGGGHGGAGALARWARARLPVEWAVLAVAAVAWAAMVVPQVAGATGGWLAPGGHAHGGGADGSGVTDGSGAPGVGATDASGVAVLGAATPAVGAALAMWALMAVAMMLPTALPAVRYVALMSRPAMRWRLAAAFVLAYLAVWMVVGLVVVGLAVVGAGPVLTTTAVGGGALAPITLIVGIVVASAWELTRWKQRALAQCCRTVPIRLRGWPATASALGFGARNAGWCVVACGPAMAVLMAAGHPLVATVVVGALLASEKLVRRGAAIRPWAAATGLALAALTLV